MASVKFDGTEILNTTYVPRIVGHESAPELFLTLVDLPREDGSLLTSSRRGPKRIPLSGVLVDVDQANLEFKIDSFKELFARKQKLLEISWGSSYTRTYVATCVSHDFDRDHFHRRYVPWRAVFVVPDGVGYDANYAQSLHLNSGTEFDASAGATKTFGVLGSLPIKPQITVTVGSLAWARTKGIMVQNPDTGEKIIVPFNGSWDTGDKIVIDCDAKTVKETVTAAALKDVPLFYGVFPTFTPAVTNSLYVVAGAIPVQEVVATPSALSTSLDLDTLTTKYIAQSFQVQYTDDTFRSVELVCAKVGAPGNFTLEIVNDNAGKPGASVIASFTGGPGVGTSPAFVRWYSAAIFTLTADTKYWLRMKQTAGTLNGSNYWRFYLVTPGTYAKGAAALSTDTGATYTVYDGINSATDSDIAFRINTGEGGETPALLKVDVDYVPRNL